jgi:hypothetical protein
MSGKKRFWKVTEIGGVPVREDATGALVSLRDGTVRLAGRTRTAKRYTVDNGPSDDELRAMTQAELKQVVRRQLEELTPEERRQLVRVVAKSRTRRPVDEIGDVGGDNIGLIVEREDGRSTTIKPGADGIEKADGRANFDNVVFGPTTRVGSRPLGA